MHIAVVTKNMRAGGAERVLLQLLQRWLKMGVQCSLISMYPAEAFYRVPDEVSCYGVDKFSDNPNVDKIKKYAHLRKIVKTIRPDVILSMPEEIGIYVVLALFGSGTPVVVSERNNPWVMPDKKISRIARRMAYPFVNGLIFQTQKAASFFPAYQQRKGVVLPNPLEVSRLPDVYTGPREKVVISAGRLEVQKNFPLLIEAFSQFYQTHPDYKLVVCGEGSKRGEMEQLAKKLLPDGVWSFPGQVSDLPDRIGRASIFALSSDYEGIPNVLIEAMAVGTPAVSTDCAPGGAASLINNMENGIIVPVRDAKALADGMCYMADHPVEAAAMATEAIKVRQTLDSEQVSAKWLAYMEKCAKKQGKSV